MKKTTLLIMAAGIGSRFGTGIKQLEPVGLHDEIIMDYSIHDAISAGFNKIIFVIRKDIEADFRERIGKPCGSYLCVSQCGNCLCISGSFFHSRPVTLSQMVVPNPGEPDKLYSQQRI